MLIEINPFTSAEILKQNINFLWWSRSAGIVTSSVRVYGTACLVEWLAGINRGKWTLI